MTSLKFSVLGRVMVVFSLGVYSSAYGRDDVPASLLRARQAYLVGDPGKGIQEIRATLDANRNNRAITKNAFELLKQVKEDGGQPQSADTKLPPELSNLDVRLSRVELDGAFHKYKFALKGHLASAVRITDAKVAYFNGGVLLDSKVNLGDVTEEVEDGEAKYKIEVNNLSSPPAEGPIEIFISFDNGNVWHGWCPLFNLASTKSPEILRPRPNETLDTGTPTLIWNDFKSPEFKAGEFRRFWAAIATENPWTELVEKDSWNSDLQPTMTVPNDKALKDGPYGFSVHYSEKSKFGEITLRRISIGVQSFNVKKR